MIPTYSNDARQALDVFFGAARLLVFFEDEDCETLYEEIISRLSNSDPTIRIICLTGKDSIIQHRTAAVNRQIQSRCVYVLDKDFDDHLRKKR